MATITKHYIQYTKSQNFEFLVTDNSQNLDSFLASAEKGNKAIDS